MIKTYTWCWATWVGLGRIWSEADAETQSSHAIAVGDGLMTLYAADMERRAREVIELYLSYRHPNETAN
jgi:hypothetical protein